MAKKRGLGRSLEALLTKPSSLGEETALTMDEASTGNSKERLAFLPLDQIQRGKYQPRRDMNPDSLQELAESIKAQGVIQPIVVRFIKDAHKHEIIAGERRWRAAQLAGLNEIPVIIRDIPDEAAMAMALIENIQRESLNPIEEALALQKLIEEFKMTHQHIAEAVGKSRTSITNSLRLLSLSSEVKSLLEKGQLEMGHARALLSLSAGQQLEAAQTIVEQALSVRQAEALVRELQNPTSTQHDIASVPKKGIDPDIKRLQDSLARRLGLKVKIQARPNGKGKLIIHYRNVNEFDNLLALLPD
ncbi:MAG TPA: ParB/RepB/Spo0J family partition protein [Gammaproteobacteria bacterium]|nr:ParB/RepB/Spo0J family partition protein [Gammaproteobacteria bacterium]